MSFLTEALFYEARGFSVIPLTEHDKTPHIPWEQYQTVRATPDEIETWWQIWPDANIGIVTGCISGILVIDVADKTAVELLKRLVPEIEHPPLVATGRGGWHLYFHGTGEKIPQRRDVRSGITFLGEGSYAIAVPSIHPNGAVYTWKRPLNGVLPEIPMSFLRLLAEPEPSIDTFSILPHPEYEHFTVEELKADLLRIDQVIKDAKEFGIPEDSDWFSWMWTERNLCLSAMKRSGLTEHGPTKQVSFWPEPVGMKEFMNKPLDQTRWIWDQTLPMNCLSILVGKPRDGKSTLALNLALAISRGVKYFGRPTQQQKTFYVSLDNSEEDLREMLQSVGVLDDDKISVYTDVLPPEPIPWLVDVMTKSGFKFVVIDTLQRFFPDIKKIEDYAEVVKKLTPLDNAAKQNGFHVMLVHHAAKNASAIDAALGSTALKAMAPAYLHIGRVGQSRVFLSDQRRGKSFDPLCLEMRDGWLEVCGTLEDAQILQVIPDIKELLGVEENGLTQAQIRAQVDARGIVVTKAIKRLFELNEIEREGKGKRGDPWRYKLSSVLFDNSENRDENVTIPYKD